jgi:5-methylcytosine-specific restriction protein A
MGKLRTIAPLIKTIDTRTVPLGPKRVDPFYLSAGYRTWRETVIARAGARCEAVEHGVRCPKAEPHHRMFADHKHERRDGGDPFDPANGMCLCGKHHSLKTAQARAGRLGS